MSFWRRANTPCPACEPESVDIEMLIRELHPDDVAPSMGRVEAEAIFKIIEPYGYSFNDVRCALSILEHFASRHRAMNPEFLAGIKTQNQAIRAETR